MAAERGEVAPRHADLVAQRRRVALSPLLAHLLGVNQFFTDLLGHTRQHTNARLVRWWSEHQCAEPLRFGTRTMYRVRSDGHGVYDENDRRLAFFLEYDRGTESLRLLAAKLRRYHELALQGGPTWPVLFVMPDAEREQRLHHLLQQEPSTQPAATASARPSPAEAVWRPIGTTGEPRRLIDLDVLSDRSDDDALDRLDQRPFPRGH
ncbi:replication-relaxation family protein [Dactylosporangium sp. CS-047395]|uniref:replication-relaxation family protein n=1 Tax=Dactylosporangium sp. CS-047395 TaxID=3239936 RepID=UPI003D946991